MSEDHNHRAADKKTMRFARTASWSGLALWAAMSIIGCGYAPTADFPNRLIGGDGQRLTLEDLEAVANDPTLTDDQRRERFRELGIEDERLIDVLLTL